MQAHKVGYKLYGDSTQIVEVELNPGQTVVAEAGAMNYMEDDITFEARLGDGSKADDSFLGKLFDAGKRMLTGETIFLTHFTNQGGLKRRVAFAAPYPGRIIPVNLNKVGGELLCQKDAFLAAALGVHVDIAFNQRLGAGFFGGEGFVLQSIRGDGMAFIHACGTVIQKKLRKSSILVDTGCLVAFTKGIDYDVQLAGGLKSMFFGGEGLFLATLRGTGIAVLQSLPFSRLADRIIAEMPTSPVRRGLGSMLSDRDYQSMGERSPGLAEAGTAAAGAPLADEEALDEYDEMES